MRSFLLASIAALAFPACTQDITGTPGGGDDTAGPTCGNGVVDPGETCDDSNTNNGDGCSSMCQTEDATTPRVEVTVDQPTPAATDLLVKTPIAITLTSMMGFTGDVTLTASAADSTQAPITDWMLTLDSPTVTVAANGTATAHINISAGGDAAMLAGKVKITATSGSMTADASVDMTFNPVVQVTITNNGTECVYDSDHLANNPVVIKAGRQLAVYNGGTGLGFVIHSDGANGLPHETQAAPGTGAGQAYTNTITADDTLTHSFYCHPGIAMTLQEAAGVGQAMRPAYKAIN